MNGHSVVFGQLVQKLGQTTPNSSTLQDDQNEWSQCSIWTAGPKAGIFLGFITKSVKLVKMWTRISTFFMKHLLKNHYLPMAFSSLPQIPTPPNNPLPNKQFHPTSLKLNHLHSHGLASNRHSRSPWHQTRASSGPWSRTCTLYHPLH